MKRIIVFYAAIALGLAVNAQQDVIVTEKVVVTDTGIKPMHNNEQKVITLRFKGDKADEKKFVVEVDGDKIKVNGKDVAELKDVDVTIGKNRIFMRGGPGQTRVIASPRVNKGATEEAIREYRMLTEKPGKPRAMLGVGMEKTDKGVKVTSVTENSAADKAGIKQDDIITQVNSKKITTEMELSNTIGSYQPGDEVEVTYNRDGKEKKVKTTLGKREDDLAFWFDQADGKTFNFNGQHFDFNQNFEKLYDTHPEMKRHLEFRVENGEPFTWNQGDNGVFVFGGHRPKLGVNIKETESGKGLEVIEVEENSAADKAGLKKGDIITEVAGKAVGTVEDVRKAVNESKEKPFNLQYQRNGKSNSVEIKFPKKLKEASL